uniref:Putative secreted peptide n=1 Tax=Anopheles braziliensis TaxID=58242 RepID=A0A2M3ZNU7_9DIPT
MVPLQYLNSHPGLLLLIVHCHPVGGVTYQLNTLANFLWVRRTKVLYTTRGETVRRIVQFKGTVAKSCGPRRKRWCNSMGVPW